MVTKLPKLTPPEIKQAFETDRETLIGVGESLAEAAKWAAWPD